MKEWRGEWKYTLIQQLLEGKDGAVLFNDEGVD